MVEGENRDQDLEVNPRTGLWCPSKQSGAWNLVLEVVGSTENLGCGGFGSQ